VTLDPDAAVKAFACAAWLTYLIAVLTERRRY
jgi:hypothetical protein